MYSFMPFTHFPLFIPSTYRPPTHPHLCCPPPIRPSWLWPQWGGGLPPGVSTALPLSHPASPHTCVTAGALLYMSHNLNLHLLVAFMFFNVFLRRYLSNYSVWWTKTQSTGTEWAQLGVWEYVEVLQPKCETVVGFFRIFCNTTNSLTVSESWCLGMFDYPVHVFNWFSTDSDSFMLTFFFCTTALWTLTVLSTLQWSSPCQGPCGRLCVSSLPGSDQARRGTGYVWMGSSCCQPAVQELQDPGPHHWHWIPSVLRLPLYFFFTS